MILERPDWKQWPSHHIAISPSNRASPHLHSFRNAMASHPDQVDSQHVACEEHDKSACLLANVSRFASVVGEWTWNRGRLGARDNLRGIAAEISAYYHSVTEVPLGDRVVRSAQLHDSMFEKFAAISDEHLKHRFSFMRPVCASVVHVEDPKQSIETACWDAPSALQLCVTCMILDQFYIGKNYPSLAESSATRMKKLVNTRDDSTLREAHDEAAAHSETVEFREIVREDESSSRILCRCECDHFLSIGLSHAVAEPDESQAVAEVDTSETREDSSGEESFEEDRSDSDEDSDSGESSDSRASSDSVASSDSEGGGVALNQ